MRFVLVHGAWHGGWCWEPLARALEDLHHEVLTPDVPCDDVDAGLTDYAAAVGQHPGAVVVAHSLGGLVLPLVEARLHVYLCALVPVPGQPFEDFFADALDPDFGGTDRDELGRSFWPDVDVLADRLYRGHERRWAEWAFPHLRPQAQTLAREPLPLEALPETRCAYILAQDDPAVRPEWSRQVATEQLGVQPIELDGGHFPMLDQPKLLADTLELEVSKTILMPEPRELTDEERAFIDFLLAGDAGTEELREQARSARVVRFCGCGCPSVGLEVDPDAPRIRASQMYIRSEGRNRDGKEVAVTLTAAGGTLVDLEIWSGEFGETEPPPVSSLSPPTSTSTAPD